MAKIIDAGFLTPDSPVPLGGPSVSLRPKLPRSSLPKLPRTELEESPDVTALVLRYHNGDGKAE